MENLSNISIKEPIERSNESNEEHIDIPFKEMGKKYLNRKHETLNMKIEEIAEKC